MKLIFDNERVLRQRGGVRIENIGRGVVVSCEVAVASQNARQTSCLLTESGCGAVAADGDDGVCVIRLCGNTHVFK